MTAEQVIAAVEKAGAVFVDGVLVDPEGRVGPGVRRAARTRAAEIAAAVRADDRIAIHSGVLGETILLAADEEEAERPSAHVIYTRAEAAALAGVDEHSLRIVHEIKRLFGGKVL